MNNYKASGFDVRKNAVAAGTATHPEQGFTLIELSIVLVIIGLIVGGVLVGQDLIKAAEVRATVGQIEKYNSAVNTFRSKYNGIPGDLSSTNAAAFGFTARAGTTGEGDNNGLVDGTVASPSWSQEAGMFWNDLSVANLVDGNYTSAENLDGAAPLAVSLAQVPITLPPARLGRGNSVTVGSANGLNYYLIAGISAIDADGTYHVTANLTPSESYNMDNKLDDGKPTTGVVQAKGAAGASITVLTNDTTFNAASVSGNCVIGSSGGSDTAATYNRAITTGGSVPACIMRFRFN